MLTIEKFKPKHLNDIKSLFLAYQEELGLDLCFQGFQEELDQLPGAYAEPLGCILVGLDMNDKLQAVVALKALKEEGVCEMKRLYVAPFYRKKKIGYALVAKLIESAKEKGFTLMKLDTLEKLQAAVEMYKKFGFKECSSYNFNPDATVKYFEKSLING